MKPRAFIIATALIFSLVALAHLIRIALGLTVVIGDWHVPISLSWVAFVVLVILVGYAVKLAQQVR